MKCFLCGEPCDADEGPIVISMPVLGTARALCSDVCLIDFAADVGADMMSGQ